MKKCLKNALEVLGYTIIILVAILGYSVKVIIKAPVWGKAAVIIAYSGMVIAFIFKRHIFWVVLGTVVVVSIFFATYITKASVETKNDWSYESPKESMRKIPFFEGLDKEAAKEEYHRLMKIYHPDNGKSGDLLKTQEVATAYSQYVAQYGR